MKTRSFGILAVVIALASVSGNASATGSKSAPKSGASSKGTAPSAPDPSKYEFIVEKDKPLEGWEAMHIKGAGEDEGYILYEHVPDSQAVVIHSVKGIKTQPGAGEALKREVLRRFPPKVVLSQLVHVNRERLLDAWGTDFPQHPDLDALRKQVPAMKFDGFDYEISVKGALIYLKMTPTSGSGKVTVSQPKELDAIFLLAHPKKDPKPASSATRHH